MVMTPYNRKDEPDIHGSARMCTGSKLGACVIGHMMNAPLVIGLKWVRVRVEMFVCRNVSVDR